MSEKDNNIKKMPAHVAIIMDGNGRWARQRGRERTYGHHAGAETVNNIVSEAARMGIKFLTLYTFSMENWSRPEEEVDALMELLWDSIEEETLMKNDISFRVIGDMDMLPSKVAARLRECEKNTVSNKRMCLVLALSYSSRWEITQAARAIATKAVKGQIKPEEINEETLSEHMATNFMPDPDLLIRTGGECRLSNYLLWQCAYTEFYFTDTYWPDFDEAAFHKAVDSYRGRERRFGKTSEQI